MVKGNLFGTDVVLIVDTLKSFVLIGGISEIVARRELFGLSDDSLDVVVAHVNDCS